jgi:hypothetical protein
MVTLIGLIINMVGSVLFWYWDDNFSREGSIPVWVYVFGVTCLFTY